MSYKCLKKHILKCSWEYSELQLFAEIWSNWSKTRVRGGRDEETVKGRVKRGEKRGREEIRGEKQCKI